MSTWIAIKDNNGMLGVLGLGLIMRDMTYLRALQRQIPRMRMIISSTTTAIIGPRNTGNEREDMSNGDLLSV